MKVKLDWRAYTKGQLVGENPQPEKKAPVLRIEPENEAEVRGLLAIFGPHRDHLVVELDAYNEDVWTEGLRCIKVQPSPKAFLKAWADSMEA